MREQLVIRGVPERLANDAWWFLDEVEGTAAPMGARKDGRTRPLPPRALVALAVLVVLADGLFWDHDSGISVALYAFALSACILAVRPGGVSRVEGAWAFGLTLACNLPVIEQVQPLSLAFSGAGVVGTLTWVAHRRVAGAWQAIMLFATASSIGPMALPFDIADDLRGRRTGIDPKALARATILPAGIGAVFVVLFALANPLVDNTLSHVTSIDIFTPEQMRRFTFWIIAACLLWPYLTTQGRWRLDATPRATFTAPTSALINTGSVRTSLVLFNVMFAVQTVTDLGILTGGMALPDGMTYAEYAHRGAYPLAVTALLSGLFAIATHRMIADNKLLRGLMYLWLGQNLFLVLTASVRLSLYVEAYTLTYTRVAAFIGFGLVFVALVLIVVQMAQGRRLAWLIRSNSIAVTMTLYVCCFVNFAYLITDYNMANTSPEALDLEYLCNLGEQAIPAMMEYGQITDQTACGRGRYPALRFDPIADWQEWGFRRWRLQRYLETYHDL